MNKKILGVGILAIVVIGLIVVGRSLKRPEPVATDNAASAQQQDAPAVATTSQPQKQAPRSPQKAAAKPSPSAVAPAVAPEDVMLDLSTEFAQSHRDILEKYLKFNADFDGHYVVAKWDCGNNCTAAAVIDKKTGKSYLAPVEHRGSKIPGPNFQFYSINSNLFKVIDNDLMDTYSFDGSKFTLVDIEDF